MTSLCRRLIRRLAFSESRHFSWDVDPANTMAYNKAGDMQKKRRYHFLDGVFCKFFWFSSDFVTPQIRYADTHAFFFLPKFSCDEHTIIQIVHTMDAAAQCLRQKMPSKLSRTAKLKQQREKEKHVATVGANQPAVTALLKNMPSNPEITSQVICRTSPCRKSPVNGFMRQQAAARLNFMIGLAWNRLH